MVALQPERKRSSQVIPLRGVCVGTWPGTVAEGGAAEKPRRPCKYVPIKSEGKRTGTKDKNIISKHIAFPHFPALRLVLELIRINILHWSRPGQTLARAALAEEGNVWRPSEGFWIR